MVHHSYLPGPRWPQLWGQEHQARLHQEGVLHPLHPAPGHRGHDSLLCVPAPPAVPEPDMSGGQSMCCQYFQRNHFIVSRLRLSSTNVIIASPPLKTTPALTMWRTTTPRHLTSTAATRCNILKIDFYYKCSYLSFQGLCQQELLDPLCLLWPHTRHYDPHDVCQVSQDVSGK